jgi:hypothetical protein
VSSSNGTGDELFDIYKPDIDEQAHEESSAFISSLPPPFSSVGLRT